MPSGSAEAQLAEIERNVGRPPRIFSRLRRTHGKSSPPAWLKPSDLITRIYERQDRILRDGVARWAAVVHANYTLFQPGAGESGAQVVYAPRGDVALDDLRRIAARTFALKGTTPSDPAQRRIADMLTDEMERALDWPLPPQMTGGRDVTTTIVQLPRAHMPDGFLGLNYFPILADPATSLAVLVPERYWPADLRAEWQANTRAAAAELDARPIVTLTLAAAAEVRDIAASQQRSRYWLRVGTTPDGDGLRYLLDITEDPPDPARDVAQESQGVPVVVNRDSRPYLLGTTLDYRNRPGDKGFHFDNPNMTRRPTERQ